MISKLNTPIIAPRILRRVSIIWVFLFVQEKIHAFYNPIEQGDPKSHGGE